MGKRIAILVDNPLRDLPACILLGAELSSDFQVFLVPTAIASTDLFRLQPDLVILNYLRESNKALVEKLVQAGIQFSVLDTEGGLFMDVPGTDENTYTMTVVKDSSLRNKVAQFFVWGEDLAALFKKRQYYPEVHCMGTPRMDFFSDSFREYYPSLPPDSKPMILINTSFAGNNPRFSSKEAEMKMLVNKFNYAPEFIDQFFANLDSALYGYIDLTKDLAKRLLHVQFILRPHPFESHDIYHQHFKGISNISIDGSGTSADWIWKTKALIHYECSTAVEAAFFKKPNLSLLRYKDLKPMLDIQKITEYADNIEDMLQKLNSILEQRWSFADTSIASNLVDLEKRIYFKVDGQAYLRIAHAIRNWFSARSAKKTLKHRLKALNFFCFFGMRSIVKLLIRGHVIPKGKSLSTEEVIAISRRLARVLYFEINTSKIPLSGSFSLQRK